MHCSELPVKLLRQIEGYHLSESGTLCTETEITPDWLANHGCDVVQGYFFSRPLDADAARNWLSRPVESESVATA